MRRARKPLATLCIALVVFAVFVPIAAANVVYAILVPLGLVIPTATAAVVRRLAASCDERPVSLLWLDPSRAPPARFVLA